MEAPPTGEALPTAACILAISHIWRSSNLLIKQHGEDAVLETAQCADALLEKGDMDGCCVWKRIGKAIDELERTERKAGESLN